MEIDNIRRTVSSTLEPDRRGELGQFFTPSSIALKMAEMFSRSEGPLSIMDAGAGVGSLISAACSRFEVGSSEVWEIDPALVPVLEKTLSSLDVPFSINNADFIEDCFRLIDHGRTFDRAILNPPYRKIGRSSHHRKMLERVGIRASNLYTAFIALTLLLLKDGGELVALVPRSFLNGLYHRPFRLFLLGNATIDAIHVFNSRTAPFSDDGVLQENIIIKLTKTKSRGSVILSESTDGRFSDMRMRVVEFDGIVRPGDENLFIRIPGHRANPSSGATLQELGIDVSTGPIVEYRARPWASDSHDAVPVISSKHFTETGLVHPSTGRSVLNRIAPVSAVEASIWPSGDYVVVKRISPNEARKRIRAFRISSSDLPGDRWAFENRLNVFHARKRGLDPTVADRLCDFLNSPEAEEEFKSISGTTQVNSIDLKALSYPSNIGF